ncbi:MAG: GNAT family N-acetyltransferase [Gaiellaceae bacterium]
MGVVVRQLKSDEVRAASLLLARAFAGDPFIGYFLADRRRRRFALPPFFRAVLHELAASDALYACEADGRLAGAAAWSPPELSAAPKRSKLLARAASAEVHTLFPRAAPRMRSGFGALGAHHPPVPHWYLAFVGIEPGQQRRGLGRGLLAPVLERADAAAITCYLETPFPDTRAFYQRLGFEDTDQLRPVAGAPPIWTMTRPASSHTASLE